MPITQEPSLVETTTTLLRGPSTGLPQVIWPPALSRKPGTLGGLWKIFFFAKPNKCVEKKVVETKTATTWTIFERMD